MSHESDLGYLSVVVEEAAITPKSRLLERWNGLYQTPEVAIEYREVRIQAVVRENGSLSGPAQQEPAPYPITAMQLSTTQGVIEMPEVTDESGCQERSQWRYAARVDGEALREPQAPLLEGFLRHRSSPLNIMM